MNLLLFGKAIPWPARYKLLLIMKLMAFLILVATLHVSASTFSQKVSVTGNNLSLKVVFDIIEQQTGYQFVYRPEVIQNSKPVTLDIANADITEVLDKCFENQDLDYKINKNIVAVKRPVKAGGVTPPLEKTDVPPVAGIIRDADGNPVVGVNVAIKGTRKGTTTDEAGRFSINAKVGDVLLVSSVNYESQEIKLSNEGEIRVTLKIKRTGLESVNFSVSTGFQNIPKERATGSFGFVDNKLLNRSVSSDLLTRLKGIVPGVLFDKTADNPLGISIRGRSTINATTAPLVVVDNFQYHGNINNINPNDIESLTILKDAAAASVWGAQSGNGVIVITTKRGKYGQPVRLSMNTNITFTEKPDLKYNREFLNSSDYIDVERFLYSKGFYNDRINNQAQYPVLTPVVETLEKVRLGLISEQEGEVIISQFRTNDIRNDYSKYLYRKSVNQSYGLNVSGGSDKTTYYMSAGYDKNLAHIVGNSSDRKTINAFMTFMPFRHLEISGGIYYAQANGKNNGLDLVDIGAPFQNIYPYARLADENGNPLPVAKDYNFTFAQAPPVSGLQSYEYNPLIDRGYLDNTNKSTEYRLTASVKYSFLSGFSAEAKFQQLNGSAETKELRDKESYYTRNLINQYAIISGTEATSSNIPAGSILSLSNSSTVSNNGRFQLTYSKNISEHSVNILTGVDVTETKVEGHSSTLYGYDKKTGVSGAVNFNTVYPIYPSGSGLIPGKPFIIPYTLDRFRAYFGNASYTYRGKYTASASGRIDQSNLFGVKTNQKSIPLWSAGVKWDIDKELVYNISWLPVLKIRATYGFQGNLDKSLTALTTASAQGADALTNLPYAIITRPGNPNLRWEKIGMLNLAVDFGSKNGVVSGSIEVYKKKGIDLIGDQNIPSSSGFNTARGNYANMKGSGFEMFLATRNLDRSLKWTTSFILNLVKDKVTKNEGNTSYYPGYPVNNLASFRWGGLDQNGDPLGYINDTLSTNYVRIAELHVADRNLFVIHNTLPQLFGSIINTFSCRNLSLSLNIIYKAKYYYRKQGLSYSALFSSGAGHVDYQNRWQQKGDEANTDVPAMVYIDYPQFDARSTFYGTSTNLVEKGDHIRLQDISLSYEVLKSKYKRLPFNNFRLYVYARDLGIIWSSNKAIDPDNLSVKPSKSVAFGVNIGL